MKHSFMRRLFVTVFFWNMFFVHASIIQFEDLSLSEAQAKAKAENKFVFVDFYTDWCRPCKVMEQEVFTVDSIADFFGQHFIAIRVNAEREQQSLVTALGIKAYPTLTFYEPKGRLVYRREGLMSPTDFYDLAESLVSINDQLSAYEKNDRKIENVYPYLSSLKWINTAKATRLARNYLLELNEKEYHKALNWALIRELAPPWDAVLFTRIAKSEFIRSERPKELEEYLLRAFDALLNKAMETGNSAYLRRRSQYINAYGSFVPNQDSLLLVGKVQYYAEHDVRQYPEHIEQYVHDYLPEDASTYASIAYDLSQRYFQQPVLELAIDLAHRSNAMQQNLFAYLALANANDKLLQHKAAYGFLLLAYQYADETRQAALRDLEQELKHKMEIELQSGVSLVDQLKDDGRFTLGAGSQRLMYGYPIPQSTSHFVVNIDGKLASNSPLGKGVQHLKGISSYSGGGITPAVETTFEFQDVTITQRLEPVDKHGQIIEHGLAQYYRIVYTLSTQKAGSKNVGLSLLFDTMMDDNDACPIGANGVLIPHEYSFKGRSIPDELLFFQNPNDTSLLVGSALLDRWEATRPDLLIVGRWPYLHRVKWAYQLRRVPYGDSAYMLRWQNKALNPLKSLTFTTYYGLPQWKKPELRIIMKDDKSTLSMESDIYFEHDKHTLDLNGKMKIQELLDNEAIDVVGVILQGYADISGKKGYNFELSKKRIASVGRVFTAMDIPFVPKPYGFDQSEKDYYSYKYGNAFDRKVRMILYYRLRGQETVTSALHR